MLSDVRLVVTFEGEGNQGNMQGFSQRWLHVCFQFVGGKKKSLYLIWVSCYMILYFNTKLQQNCSQLKAILTVAQKPFTRWL